MLLLLLARAHKYVADDVDVVDEELEGILPLAEDSQAADQLLADGTTHLQLYRTHLLIHLINTASHLLTPVLELLWLEAAALDEAVSESLEQCKVNLSSWRTLYKLIAFTQSLKGLCELPQILVDQPYFGALLELAEY